MYEIVSDIKAIEILVESLVDEDGNRREPTEEEKETILKWIGESENAFYAKADNICKFVKNLQIEANIADAERKAHKDELDRLSRTANARENKARAVKGILHYAMDRLNLKKYKSALFSLNIQATAKTARMMSGKEVPLEYAKPNELDSSKVKEALKDGSLIEKEGVLYTIRGENTGIAYLGGETLVIR
jgi:hypothetical protein